MRVLIAAIGKTGSTALADLLHRSLPDHELVFEPSKLAEVPAGPDVICKYFLRDDPEALAHFAGYDRVLLLVRHPFDTLVSYAMYVPYTGAGFVDDAVANGYLELIARKIEAPGAVSFREIFDYCDRHSGVAPLIFGRHDMVASAADGPLRDALVFRYEDMVDGRLDSVAGFLGTALDRKPDSPPRAARVRRTGTHGDWMRWFDESDCVHFGAIAPLATYARRFDYALRPPDGYRAEPVRREESTDYVAALVEQSRRRWRLPAFRAGVNGFRDAGGHVGRALQAYHRGRSEEALAQLDEAQRLGAESRAIDYLRGLAHRRNGALALAAEAFGRLADSAEPDAHVLIMLARTCLAADQPGKALAAARRAAALQPTLAEAAHIARLARRKKRRLAR